MTKACILRRNFDIVTVDVPPAENHIHFGKGSYFVINNAVKRMNASPSISVLIYQEGNAIPKGARGTKEFVGERVYWPTTMRGIAQNPHTRTPEIIKKIGSIATNPKYWPALAIGGGLLVYFLDKIMGGL